MKRLQRSPRYLLPFDPRKLPRVRTEVLVIGSGVAGLRAAIEAASGLNVLVISKDVLTECNTEYAQGGIAVVLDPRDDRAEHIHDTLAAGAGLCAEAVVEHVVGTGPDRVQELISWGARFDCENGVLLFGREGGHSRPRIVHAHGDTTGREVERALLARARTLPNVSFAERVFLVDLITSDHRCVGALARYPDGNLRLIEASAVVLASGGAGQIYRETTNPSVTTGDGIAAAYRAGAQLADMEFMQFHPTTLYIAGAARTLISEAVRGEGALLRDRFGVHFMPNYHPDAELAPRDIVSRSILRQMHHTGDTNVYLDMRHLGADTIRRRFPFILETLAAFDLDPTEDLIPVRPSAHYMIGGVRVDLDGRSTLPGLLAAGEAACSGLHGANRLASNSLLEGLVLGRSAGRTAALVAHETTPSPLKLRVEPPHPKAESINLSDVANALKATMWRNVGIERNYDGLQAARERLEFWASYVLDRDLPDPRGLELRNMLTLARLMTLAAHTREETRGTHHRTDFPDPDDARWRKHIVIQRDADVSFE
ncbi:MAG: L-aspartate oxidase [Planctomycetota bacterium]